MLEYLLSTIFGNHIGPIDLVGPANPIVHDIFKNFNTIVMSSIIILISSVGLISTVSTANSGRIMAGRWSLVTVLMRSMVGVLLLAPMPGSGYSTVQVGSIWLAMQGSNFATKTLALVVDYFERGISVTKSPELPEAQKLQLKRDGEKLTWQLLNSAVCMKGMQSIGDDHAINSDQDKVHPTSFISQFGKLVYPNRTTPVMLAATSGNVEYDANFDIGVIAPNLAVPEDGSMICGRFNVKTIVGTQELSGASAEVSSRALEAARKEQDALYAIFRHILPLAERIAAHHSKSTEHFTAIIQEYIKEGGDIYVEYISGGLIKPKQEEQTTEVFSYIEKAKQTDWIGMGAWYANLGKAPPIELLNTASKPPEVSRVLDNTALTVPSCDIAKLQRAEPGGIIPELSLIQKYVLSKPERDYLCEKLSIIHYAQNADHGVDSSAGTSRAAEGDPHTISSVMTIIQNFRQLIQQTRISGGVDVTAMQVDFGNKLIVPAEQYLTAPTFTMNLESIALIIIWICGIILVFYVPLMPCIMYTTAVLGWFMLVVQSFFVLPILGISLIMPSNEMIGRVAKKLALPIEILALPFLNVVTFILVIRLYKIGVELINLIMLNTVTVSFLGVSKLASVMGIVIYVFLTLITMNICFSLFYKMSHVITTAIQDALSHQETNVQSQQTAALKTTLTQNLVEKNTAMTGISTRVTGGSTNASGLIKDPSGMSSGTTNSSGSHPLVPPSS